MVKHLVKENEFFIAHPGDEIEFDPPAMIKPFVFPFKKPIESECEVIKEQKLLEENEI